MRKRWKKVSESEEHQQAKPGGGKVYTKRSQGV
jgi:hypothetical protein